jgi:hypothetical protein
VDTDLVTPAGLKSTANQGPPTAPFKRLVVRDGALAATANHTHDTISTFLDVAIDTASLRRWHSRRQREVVTLGRVIPERNVQGCPRFFIKSEREAASGVLIEAVHGMNSPAQLLSQKVDHRGRVAARGWHNEHPLGLIDDEQVVIVVQYGHERHGGHLNSPPSLTRKL